MERPKWLLVLVSEDDHNEHFLSVLDLCIIIMLSATMSNKMIMMIDITLTDHADTIAEAVLELLKIKDILLFPFVGETFGSSVVPGQSVDSGLNQDQSVFGILIFLALLHVLPDVHCLLNQTVNILRDLWGTTYINAIVTVLLQQSDYFLSC